MKRLKCFFVFILAMSCFVVACKKQDSPLTRETPTDIDSIVANYYEQYLKLNPIEATQQGDERYNDQLPINIDKDFITAEIAFYKNVQDQLLKVDYKKLADDKKTVHDVLKYTLEDKIERYDYHPEFIPFTQFAGLPLDFPLLGSGAGSQPFKTEKNYEDWLRRMEKFPFWMKQAQENFKEGISAGIVLPKKLVVKMIPQMNDPQITTTDFQKNIFYGPVLNFPQNFTPKQKEKYTKLFEESILKNIIPAYEKMGKFLETEYLPKSRNTDGLNGMANGKQQYLFLAKSYTTTNKTPKEMHQIGLQQVSALRQEMSKVQKEVGFSGTLEEFIHHVKEDPAAMPYKTSAEVLGAFQNILKKIQPGLKQMFSVTPVTGFEIKATEKFRENTASAEYIQGSADGKRPGIFYIPIPNPERFNVTSGMESLFLHEAIPGHHYQISLQQENKNLPKFMRFGWFGAYGEGWAHYCETLGPAFGLYKDPYQKMGYLSDQMLRAVRLVIDTALHTGTMNREEAIDFFLKNVAYDQASATAEVERYMAVPGQALGYKIGSLKIQELRNKYHKKLGKDFNIAHFHDEVLSQGCLPLDVLETKMELWAKREKNKK